MKRIILLISFVATVFAWGCNDDYFAEDGPPVDHSGILGVSTMDYLESQPEKFDTLATLIRLCGLESEVNRPGSTFMAPMDYSIHNYFRLVFPEGEAWPELTEIPAEMMEQIAGILKNYIIPDQEIVREGLSTAYSYATAGGGRKARFNIAREDYLDNPNMGAAYIVFSLEFSNSGSTLEQYQSVTVAISGLRSTNGIVHVLRADTHIFGFN